MAVFPAQITHLVWDNAKNVLTVNAVADDAPPPPNDGHNYSAPTGTQLAFDVPTRKAITDAPTITRVETSPQGFVLTRYTWNGSAWANPVRVNQNGDPI